MKHLEIERKFLIKMPNKAELEAFPQVRVAEITQTYTTLGIRLRKWTENGQTKYIQTVKKHITNVTRTEEEGEISKEEYNALLKFAATDRIVLQKTRYSLPYEGKIVEVDVFPFWTNQAFLEVELTDEEEEIRIPDFLCVIKEVTDDLSYRNYSLTKKIPKEENF